MVLVIYRPSLSHAGWVEAVQEADGISSTDLWSTFEVALMTRETLPHLGQRQHLRK